MKIEYRQLLKFEVLRSKEDINMDKANKRFGFTLMEILITITIMGLLGAVAFTSYGALSKSARDSKRKSDLEQMRGALEIYKSANGTYPTTNSSWSGICSNVGSKTDSGVSGYIPDLAPAYLQKLPHDPKESKKNNNSSYPAACSDPNWNCYMYYSNGTEYKLIAHCTVENPVDSTSPYYDPTRTFTVSGKTYSYSLQVSSSQNAYQNF